MGHGTIYGWKNGAHIIIFTLQGKLVRLQVSKGCAVASHSTPRPESTSQLPNQSLQMVSGPATTVQPMAQAPGPAPGVTSPSTPAPQSSESISVPWGPTEIEPCLGGIQRSHTIGGARSWLLLKCVSVSCVRGY